MKALYVILILFLLNTQICNSQTFSSVDKLSNYIGKGFSDLETGLSIKSNSKKTILGLEHRAYYFKGYSAIVSEVDDSKIIGEISISTDQKNNLQELWYNIVSKMNQDSNYTFIKSFVADRDDKVTSNTLDYQELIALLRKSYKSDQWIYEVKYRNNDKYFLISCSPISVEIQIQNRPFEKKSYEN